MKIAICDDEALFRSSIIMRCKEYAGMHKCNFEFIEFNAGEELLEYSEEIDLVFLDIELPRMNGLEVKEQLEAIDEIGNIVFITSHHEAIYDAFGKKTIGYMLKPLDGYNFNYLLDKVIKEQNNSTFIEIIEANTPIAIPRISIVYIKSDNIYTQVTTTKKSYIVRKSLNEWENNLKQTEFYRIHKSYLVNMRFIKGINNNKVILDNGVELNVGRSKIKELREAYNNYIRRKMH